MSALRIIEENERSVGTVVDSSEKEGSCGCGCGCGGGVVREAKSVTRSRPQPDAATEATHQILGRPYGCCGTRRFS